MAVSGNNPDYFLKISEGGREGYSMMMFNVFHSSFVNFLFL